MQVDGCPELAMKATELGHEAEPNAKNGVIGCRLQLTDKEPDLMRVSLLLLSLVALGLAGCIDVHDQPPARTSTVVTPPPQPGAPGTVITTRP
jgi:hypothetical protein